MVVSGWSFCGLLLLWFGVNWYGERVWKRALADFEAEKPVFTMPQDSVPDSSPELRLDHMRLFQTGLHDDQLFGKVLKNAEENSRDSRRDTGQHYPSSFDIGPSYGRAVDGIGLRHWSRAFRQFKEFPRATVTNRAAEVVLNGLLRWHDELDAVRTLVQMRRRVGYIQTNEFKNIGLQDRATLGRLCQMLSLRSAARLDLGDVDGAVEDIISGGEIYDSCRGRIAGTQLGRHPQLPTIWKGLVCHLWRDGDLVKIQGVLASSDPRVWGLIEIDGGRRDWLGKVADSHEVRVAFAINWIGDILRAEIENAKGDFDRDSGQNGNFSLPDWSDLWSGAKSKFQETWYISKCLSRCFVPAVRRRDEIKVLDLSRRFTGLAGNRWIDRYMSIGDVVGDFESDSTWYYAMGDGSYPADRFLITIKASSNADRLRRLAITACAIERFRIKHFDVSRDLAALEPYLAGVAPIDPTSGKPLFYRRLPKADYILSGSYNPQINGFESQWPAADYSWIKEYH